MMPPPVGCRCCDSLYQKRVVGVRCAVVESRSVCIEEICMRFNVKTWLAMEDIEPTTTFMGMKQ